MEGPTEDDQNRTGGFAFGGSAYGNNTYGGSIVQTYRTNRTFSAFLEGCMVVGFLLMLFMSIGTSAAPTGPMIFVMVAAVVGYFVNEAVLAWRGYKKEPTIYIPDPEPTRVPQGSIVNQPTTSN